MKEIEFVFLTEPKPIQSVRFCRFGERVRTYQPKSNIEWKNFIRLSASKQIPENWEPLEGAIGIKVDFVFSPLRSFSKKTTAAIFAGYKVFKETKPDLCDNLLKGLCDALSGICWRDDSQICKVESEKYFGNSPMIIIKAKEIGLEKKEDSPDLFVDKIS